MVFVPSEFKLPITKEMNALLVGHELEHAIFSTAGLRPKIMRMLDKLSFGALTKRGEKLSDKAGSLYADLQMDCFLKFEDARLIKRIKSHLSKISSTRDKLSIIQWVRDACADEARAYKVQGDVLSAERQAILQVSERQKSAVKLLNKELWKERLPFLKRFEKLVPEFKNLLSQLRIVQ
mgnify:CR=1 FL=1